MKKTFLYAYLLCVTPCILSGQNVGIGSSNPSEKLQVDGKIYSSQGGIKFPDQTVQTTAAFNSTPESVAIPQGIGFIEFTLSNLEGPIDTLGKTDVSLIYNMEWDVKNSGANRIYSPVTLVKQIDKSSPNLMKHYFNQATSSDAYIYLTRDKPSGGLEIYAEVKLTKFSMANYGQKLTPGGGGGFAHVEYLDLEYQTIQVKDLPSGGCFCWSLLTNLPCSCSN